MRDEGMTYEFSPAKNEQLIRERGVSFEEAIAALDNDKLLDIMVHPNAHKYPTQLIYVIDIRGYVYLLPFIRKNESTVFLKTLFPSRKLTKLYLNNGGAS